MDSNLLLQSENESTPPRRGPVDVRAKHEIFDSPLIPLILVATMLAVGIIPIFWGR
jgi:hypothetical protein